MEKEAIDSRKKMLYLLLAVVVAASIWLFADLTSGVNGGARTTSWEFKDIPIEYTYEGTLTDRGLMLLEEGTDQTISLTLEGTRWLVSNLDRSKIRVTVSLSNVNSAGTQTIGYLLGYTDWKFPWSSISVKEASIGIATVNISELYSRTIPVSCELVGNVAETYSAGQVELSHTEIEIRGQSADIDPVSYAKITLDIGDAAVETISRELTVQYYDASGHLLDSEKIHSAVDAVQATLPVYVTKEVQLSVNFSDAPGARLRNTWYEIEPKTITVSGDATQLKHVDTLYLGDFNLLDLGTSAAQNVTTSYYPIILPDGCQNLSGVTRAVLKIRFTDMTSAVVTTDNIIWKNVPEGKRAELLAPELNVTIFGTDANVSAVTGENVAITVDLNDYNAALGTYTIPANVSVTLGDVGIVGDYQVQVNIQEGSAEPPEEESPSEAEGGEASP